VRGLGLTVLLSGLKRYKAIAGLFGATYLLIVLLALPLRAGAGRAAGRLRDRPRVLLAGMWADRAAQLSAAKALDRLRLHAALADLSGADRIGLLYNLGIWADKFMFWYFPPTSQQIIGGSGPR
jgi:uncharacterized membrane protein